MTGAPPIVAGTAAGAAHRTTSVSDRDPRLTAQVRWPSVTPEGPMAVGCQSCGTPSGQWSTGVFSATAPPAALVR